MEEHKLMCPSCGHYNDVDSNRCQGCGYVLRQSSIRGKRSKSGTLLKILLGIILGVVGTFTVAIICVITEDQGSDFDGQDYNRTVSSGQYTIQDSTITARDEYSEPISLSDEDLMIRNGLPERYVGSMISVFNDCDLRVKFATFSQENDWASGERYRIDYGEIVPRTFLVYFNLDYSVESLFEVTSSGGRSKIWDISGNVAQTSENTSVQEESSANPVVDYDYVIDGNIIKLNSYSGDLKTLEIPSVFILDEKEYKVDLTEFSLGYGNSVNTIIFLDGIEKVNMSVFNSSDVVNVYFPRSMKSVFDKQLMYLHPAEGELINVYYAGTKDEWENIFKEYTCIADAYDTDELELGESAGIAAADFINGLFGATYDESEFAFYFLASPEDLR